MSLKEQDSMYMEVVSSEENIPGAVHDEAVYDEIDEYKIVQGQDEHTSIEDRPIYRISSKVV